MMATDSRAKRKGAVWPTEKPATLPGNVREEIEDELLAHVEVRDVADRLAAAMSDLGDAWSVAGERDPSFEPTPAELRRLRVFVNSWDRFEKAFGYPRRPMLELIGDHAWYLPGEVGVSILDRYVLDPESGEPAVLTDGAAAWDAWLRAGEALVTEAKDKVAGWGRGPSRKRGERRSDEWAHAVQAFVARVVDVLTAAGEPVTSYQVREGRTVGLLRVLLRACSVPAPRDLKRLVLRAKAGATARRREAKRVEAFWAEFEAPARPKSKRPPDAHDLARIAERDRAARAQERLWALNFARSAPARSPA